MKIDFRKNPEAPGAAPVESVSEFVPTPASGLTVECQTTVAPSATVSTPAMSVPAVVSSCAPGPFGPPARPQAPAFFDEDEVQLDDIKIPRMNIVQKVGPMSNTWTPGEIIFNQQVVLYSPKKGETPATAGVNIVVCGFQKVRYSETVDGGMGGAIVDTEAEVVALGGTTNYQEWELKKASGVKLFKPMVTAILMVERPECVKDPGDVLFPYACEGRQYALALWTMKGSAYTNGAKVIKTAGKIGHLKRDGRTYYRAFSYQLSTELKSWATPKGEKFAERPVLKPGTKTSEEFIKFTDEIFGLNS